MKIYNEIIRYRLWIGIGLLVIAIVVNITSGFWPSFVLYLLAVIALFTHFFIGPMRLLQEHMESGDFEAAEKILNGIKYPKLLYKPIRSAYYSLKGQMAMMRQDFNTAEAHMRESEKLGLPMAEAQGANKLQLGMLAIQRGDTRQGESYIKQAIKLGIPDKDSAAMAYLQMSQIYMQKMHFKASKDMFRKAKMQKATNKDVVEQIKKLESVISRMPG